MQSFSRIGSLAPSVLTAITTPSGLPSNSLWALGGVRTKIRRPRNYVSKLDPEGIKYHGFTYFPRHPEEVDPPCTPAKLFRVTRVKPLKGAPYWDREVLTQLHLEENRNSPKLRKVAIVANTPENNILLWRVKHMVDIKPITFPHGVPVDPAQGFLKENGEYVTYNKLESPGIGDYDQGKADMKELRRKSVDKITLKYRLSLQWNSRW